MISANQTVKQIMEFNKNNLDNVFTAFSNIGEQQEKIFRSYVDHTLLPDSSKKMVLEWVDLYRKGWSDVRKMTDENYKTFANHLESEK